MHTFTILLLAITLSLLLFRLDAATGPNIILILADDLAWSDVGCYGSESCQTPRLDRLAGQGMRFPNAYAAAPICSPARAAILTGKSPARLNFEFVTKWAADKPPSGHVLQAPPYTLDLPLTEETIAEVLRDGGYRTGFVGKWHVSSHHQTYLGWSPTHGPLQQGFEWGVETFGDHPWGDPASERRKFPKLPPGHFPPDSLTDRAVDFIQNRDQSPFFLFVSTPYVHTPVVERGPWLQNKYRDKLGPDATRKQVTYCAFVETLDHHVGRIVDAVDAAGLAKTTLVLFTSDNGGHPEYAFNAPLRGSKWNLYEGGIRVPLIARQPGTIAAGTVSNRVVVGTDLGPTIAEVAGLDFKSTGALDGRSFEPALQGDPEARPGPVIWHFPYYHPERGFETSRDSIGVQDGAVSKTYPQSAIRVGKHKLIYFYESERAELYDLEIDPAESSDQAHVDGDRARRLKAQLLAELRARGARFPKSVAAAERN